MLQTPLNELLQNRFGFQSFRPFQENVCEAAAQGRDLLLVMPTGAGKSLCYQLPGIARQGTTLVISPLIALMEDQCVKLQNAGFKAARIHAGRDRQDSRQACLDYLAGTLDFLFIAPERLAVPGFLEMLAKKTPALIAVDEAHCISQWGHDFRPEYRMLGERLPQLRPAPVIAMTATATERVQDDIVVQLGLKNGERFIHGFRRDNIAIEVLERNPSERFDAAIEILSREGSVPAIVYARTRKEADEFSKMLRKKKRSASMYHAGLSPEIRDSVQSDFLAGRVEIIVATIAFGMGIDKSNVRTVIHAGLPSSIEGYYQEIGRAGRDGKPSRAFLLYSYADQRMHEFFMERDYPDTKILNQIHSVLSEREVDPAELRAKLKIKEETFEKALSKLKVHQGLKQHYAGISIGSNARWKTSYEKQREHKSFQIAQMLKYAQSTFCRMGHLVRHFGEKTEQACGMCDVCSPATSVGHTFRETTIEEQAGAQKILHVLKASTRDDGIATGRLFQEAGLSERSEFEQLLRGLTRAGFIYIEQASFEKDGRKIDYQRASLTTTGKTQVIKEFSVSFKFPKKKKAKVRRRRRSDVQRQY